MGLHLTAALAKATWRLYPVQAFLALLLAQSLSDIYAQQKASVYNVLWALVFGFATLNILGLTLRRFDPAKRGSLNFGEMLAIVVVIFSFLMFGMEMLSVFHILPIKLSPR